MGKLLSYFASVAFRTLLFAGCAAIAQSRSPSNGSLPSGNLDPVFGEGVPPTSEPAIHNPVADPRATILIGKARFTILTPELIRMEWSADGKFEDGPSGVFINRRLPVPRFHRELSEDKQKLTIHTSVLTLAYNAAASADGRFTPDDLTVNLPVDDKLVIWRPGIVDAQGPQGATHTLNALGYSGMPETNGPGLISRSGWAFVDDSSGPRFDPAAFSPKHGERTLGSGDAPRPPSDHLDWYFFGCGHDYKRALDDYTSVAGRFVPPLYTQIPASPDPDRHMPADPVP